MDGWAYQQTVRGGDDGRIDLAVAELTAPPGRVVGLLMMPHACCAHVQRISVWHQRARLCELDPRAAVAAIQPVGAPSTITTTTIRVSYSKAYWNSLRPWRDDGLPLRAPLRCYRARRGWVPTFVVYYGLADGPPTPPLGTP